MVRAADGAEEHTLRAELRAAERKLVWFYTASAAAIGFRAQRYDVAGGAVYHGADVDAHASDGDAGARFALWDTRTSSVLDHLQRLDFRHRQAVERHTSIRARLDALSLRDERTFELAYRDAHQLRGVLDEPEWARLRDAFRRRTALLEEQIVDAKGRPRWETKDGARVRRMAQSHHTTVTLLALAVDSREVKTAYARHYGARIGVPVAERLAFLARMVDVAALNVPEAAAFVSQVRQAAAARLDAALARFVR